MVFAGDHVFYGADAALDDVFFSSSPMQDIGQAKTGARYLTFFLIFFLASNQGLFNRDLRFC